MWASNWLDLNAIFPFALLWVRANVTRYALPILRLRLNAKGDFGLKKKEGPSAVTRAKDTIRFAATIIHPVNPVSLSYGVHNLYYGPNIRHSPSMLPHPSALHPVNDWLANYQYSIGLPSSAGHNSGLIRINFHRGDWLLSSDGGFGDRLSIKLAQL